MTVRRRAPQPTMDDVAVAAGVSRALVSLVMRGSPKVSKHSRAAVDEAAARLGYRPNLVARNLAARRSMTVGVVLDDLHNPWFAEVTDGIHQILRDHHYDMLLASGQRDGRVEARAIDTFLASRVDAIVVMASRVAPKRLREVANEVPLVSIGKSLRDTAIGTVNTDDSRGAELAVEHLVHLGHRFITHIDGGSGAGAAPRRSGYLRAMRRMGLERAANVVGGEFTESAGAAAAAQLLRSAHPTTAVFAANDLVAVGVLDALAQDGRRAPDNWSVIGFDNTALAALNHIALTTIDQPRKAMGAAAATMAIDALESGAALTHLVMPSQLIERRSTGAA